MKKIILITALWCPSCLIMRPRYQTLVSSRDDLIMEEFDYDENPQLVKDKKIGNILPVIIICDEQGMEVSRFVGEFSLKKLIEKFKQL
ncbi:MAG TPA: thioredoxin family protein [Bacilli bacterium]|nr:thioredoxin family protein [Bacilli bacterium]